MVNNIDRAEWAAQTLQTFADMTSSGQIDEDAISDLICDLGHFAQIELKLQESEILRIFAIGIGAWLAESEHPDGDPDFNKYVAITVEQ